ncbi:hypothetical protein D1AOALGA4SA_4255 [Olavius algarvensis Delta 1 endosymbiont]|nr:hypothetical protein D1AOALGA4SA_4255 [Olavius algarvensis Delta 1 endosymbiont]
MIVICEDCGKKYRIDPARIKGKAASFNCRVCDHLILVKKEKSIPSEAATLVPAPNRQVNAEAITVAMDVDTAAVVSETPMLEQTSAATETGYSRRARRFGLRAKMLILFLLVPMSLMAVAGLFSLWQFESAAKMLSQRGTKIVGQMAEEKIADISAAVAMQCKLYLLSHPELKKEDFSRDLGFKSLAVQKVGSTGYTALYQRPGSDGIWRTWAHINPKIIAIDMSTLRDTLKDSFAGFWKIFVGVKEGRISRGYYTWQDKDDKFRNKFMVCTPIAGTRFVIAATTYLDELTAPARTMEAGAREFTDKARLIALATLAAAFLLIGLIVFIYSHRLSGKIRSLAEAAATVGAGRSGRGFKTKSRDEIGDLEEAVAGLRDGSRSSFKHLRGLG